MLEQIAAYLQNVGYTVEEQEKSKNILSNFRMGGRSVLSFLIFLLSMYRELKARKG